MFEFEKSFQDYLSEAEQGNAGAYYSLGFMYSRGQGVQQDYKEAVKWYRLAVEQGDARAQSNLAKMYSEGQGLPQDGKEAAKLYRLAAEQGARYAQLDLGRMYDEGRGVPQDDREAAKWYRLAAEQESAEAQCRLGLMYREGRGVPQDDKEAVKWFSLAAYPPANTFGGHGNVNAQYNLGLMHAEGRGGVRDRKEAVKWFLEAAKRGHAEAQWNLGLMCDEASAKWLWGSRAWEEDKNAVKWFRLAAEQGRVEAQLYLGRMYNEGIGVPQDDGEAVKWYRLAAEQGDVGAQLTLGFFLSLGIGAPEDDIEAAKWYRLAAEQGNAEAQCTLGRWYSKGIGVPQDDREAVKWYRLAAEQGDTEAQCSLSEMYSEGQAPPQAGQEGYVSGHVSVGFDVHTSSDNSNNERISLLESISDIIKDYRYGEIDNTTPDHVDRWINQFNKQIQKDILSETNYVLQRTYFSKERIAEYFTDQLEYQELYGKSSHEFWSRSNFLNIQKNGQSQKEIRDLFGKALMSKLGLNLDDCGSDGGAYFYLDDALFSGNRIRSDLSTWIIEEAPEKATVYILTVVSHQGGKYWLEKELAEINRSAGKYLVFHFRNAVCYEDRKYYRDQSEVLWPTEIPNDPFLQDYLAGQKYPFENRSAGAKPQNAIFSTENGRQLLEKEFLLAGMRIRSFSQSPSDILRPLGFSAFGLGFGSMVATYRNCPNNAPLALWWGDPSAPSHHPLSKWYPLLPRKTYEEHPIK